MLIDTTGERAPRSNKLEDAMLNRPTGEVTRGSALPAGVANMQTLAQTQRFPQNPFSKELLLVAHRWTLGDSVMGEAEPQKNSEQGRDMSNCTFVRSLWQKCAEQNWPVD